MDKSEIGIEIRQYLDGFRDSLRKELESANLGNRSEVDMKGVVQRYTAVFAVNFTDWIGKTIPWVLHESAQFALKDNMRCEQTEDHAGLLYDFAESCGAFPDLIAFQRGVSLTAGIRLSLRNVRFAGLYGLSLLATLEHASIEFIPVLKDMGIKLGAQNLKYVEIHGEADKKHSDQFARALQDEFWSLNLEEDNLIQYQIMYGAKLGAMIMLDEIFGLRMSAGS